MQRILLVSLPLAIVGGLVAAPAVADSPTAATSDPALAQALVAPADGTAYHARREEARRLVLVDKDFAAAEPLVEALTRDYPQEGHNWLLLGRTELRLGKAAEAVSAYARAERMLGSGAPYRAGYWLAVSQAAAGDEPGALDTLARLVFREHYLHRPELWDDPDFAALRSDPRWRTIAGNPDPAGWTRDEGWRQDVDALHEEVARNVVLRSGETLPAAFESEYQRLRAAVPGLSDPQVVVGLSRMLSTLGRGHTGPWPFVAPRTIAFTQVPLQLYAFPEGLFVVRSARHPDLVGAEVVGVGDLSAAEAFARITDLQSRASPMEALWLGPALLSVSQYLEGAGIIASAAEVPMTFRFADGRRERRTLATVPLDLQLKLGPPPGAPTPRFLRHVDDESHWLETLPGGAALYVQVNQIAPDPDETLAELGRRLAALLAGDALRDVVLDLRHDNGGDTFTYVELLRALVGFSAREGRQLYVLIGRDVYSAAANLSTDLERLAAPIFLGEPTSMTGNNDGDESEVRLPYSGLVFGVTGARWQLGTPWDRRTSIVPDVPVPLTAADYFAGRDPVLDAALAMIAARHAPAAAAAPGR